MIINLAPVLSPKHVQIHEHVTSDCTMISMHGLDYKVTAIDPIQLDIWHIMNKDIHVEVKTQLTILIPCARCLEDTVQTFEIDFSEKLTVDSENETQDEVKNYLDGYELDVDRLLFNELLIGWPMKVLCHDDCEGFDSSRCKDADLDPRMSAIRDIYQQFKEV